MIPAVRLSMGHTVMGIQSKTLRSVETQWSVFFSLIEPKFNITISNAFII